MNFDIETFKLGLEASAYGLSGVFLVLILFYIVVKVMVGISSKRA